MTIDQNLTEATNNSLASEGPTIATRSLEMSIMLVIGTVSVIIVSGFAVYRWQTGDLRGAAINSLIVATIATALLMGRTERFRAMSLNFFGVTISSACLLSSLFVSNNGLLWALLVLLVNVLTLPRHLALGLNTVVIIVLSASAHLYESLLQQVSWATVAILISGFAQVSMNQLREQRVQLTRLANVDSLTGAGNRRQMQAHLQELCEGRRIGERNATILMIDLDRFKLVNDEHGHETGDRVLVDFASSVQSSLRAGDGFYRIGGEEFVLLFRGMDEATAQDYLPALHERLTGQVSTPSGDVEFSAGAAALREHEEWSKWLARADKALYTAKEAGRNRLSFSV